MSDDDAFDALLQEAFALPGSPAPQEETSWRRCLRCGYLAHSQDIVCPNDGAPMVPEGDARIGLLAGEYRILERLGSGGAGRVYRARHRTLGREAAVKFLHAGVAAKADYRLRLIREARHIGQLDHENIVRVIDLLLPEGAAPVLIMELVRGRTLSAVLESDGPFAPDRALHVVRQIARALARAHQRGVVHRDIKPSNLLLSRVGRDPDFVKVMDFGIARNDTDTALTQSHSVLGTPQYMSPEQAEGRSLGPESDLYSLGCVLFELLAGQPPFKGPPLVQMHAQVHVSPPPLASLAPQVPSSLAHVVDRLLQKAPAARYPSAQALLAALDLDEPRSTSGPLSTYSPQALLPQQLSEQLQTRLSQLLARSCTEIESELAKAQDALTALRQAQDAVLAAKHNIDRTERSRETRAAQLNHAVQQLTTVVARDCAKLGELDACLQTAATARDKSIANLNELVSEILPLPFEPGMHLSKQDAGVLRRAREAFVAFSKREGEYSEVLEQHHRAKSRADDVRYQLNQLQRSLSSFERDARAERDAMRAQLAALRARYDQCLEAAANATERAEGAQREWSDAAARPSHSDIELDGLDTSSSPATQSRPEPQSVPDLASDDATPSSA